MTEPKSSESKSPVLLPGTVLRASGSTYEVDVPEAPGENSAPLVCEVRGKLKHGRRESAQPVSVGDRVQVRLLDSFGPDARGRRVGAGYIEEVLPRRSSLGRARYRKTAQVAVANLDQVVVVMAAREPDLNTHRLDRFLVLAETADLQAVVCFNKCDLIKKREWKKEIEPVMKLYESIGYKCFATSAETDAGIPELREQLKEHISAFIGSSGVGKSSLVNAVQPGLHLYIGDVMEIGKGRHTTTEVSLHRLNGGGYLADTPGVKTVSLLEQEEVSLPACFPEFESVVRGCRFNDCSHTREPDCAVRAAVEDKKIAASRYDSYLKMLEEFGRNQQLSNKQLVSKARR